MADKTQAKKNSKAKKKVSEELEVNEIVTEENVVADIVDTEEVLQEKEEEQVLVSGFVETPLSSKVKEEVKKQEEVVEPFSEEQAPIQSLTAVNPNKGKENEKKPVMIAFDQWNGTYIM